jgi:hypothetical protein
LLHQRLAEVLRLLHDEAVFRGGFHGGGQSSRRTAR